ncbi:polyprenyl synthetase family protein [Stutzerimonas urumqiensis]|uniref:polyprenyl synthetase family protein n=1 Tax=Stutzerimonas urumqiensis TaxID=638269 RepID=UPI000EAFFFDB|nr:polyprenyl synthetase family protein [Stutzerimonas urumqiensis]
MALLSNTRPGLALEPALLALRTQVDARLGELLPEPEHAQDLIAEAMREGVLAPGKRVRPLLMLLALHDLDAHAPGAIDIACSLEMVHAASLFLDDLPCMDDATLRRGRPTLHIRYGEDVAVLASVALLSHAFAVVAAAPELSASVRTRAVGLLSQAIGPYGLVRGQFYDLHGGRQARALDAIATANQLKTGSLFIAALETAGLIAGCSRADIASLRSVAQEFGLAFQLLDDLNDGKASEHTGKDAHQDRYKTTVIALLGRDAARQQLRLHVRRANAQLERLGLADGLTAQLLARIFAD